MWDFARYGERAALVQDAQSLTYAQLDDACKAIGGAVGGRSLVFVLCSNALGSVAGYFAFMENGIVPLPSWTPYPGEDGLVFVYQQYEIASYAAGMPSFVIPYDRIQPFLTEEARRILSR